LGHGRHERDVELGAVRDPPVGGRAVEVADELGLGGGVSGESDPDVSGPPLVLVHAADQVADDLPVANGDGAARALLPPGTCDRRLRVLNAREQRLRCAVTFVALGEEPGCRLDVGVLEGAEAKYR
jgi:hypothetical protein